MKKQVLIIAGFLAVGSLACFQGGLQNAIAKNTGSPGGYTGSPTDARTCGSGGGCHGGGTTAVNGIISTTIPSTGYVPGANYDINVTASASGFNKFGFECAAENSSGTQVGTMAGMSDVSVISSGNGLGNATHTASGTAGSGGSKTWTWTWTAPPAGTGDVTFFAAFLAANGQNNTTGDQAFNSSEVFSEDHGISIAEQTGVALNLQTFPNPATEWVNVHFKLPQAGEVNLELSDLQGRLVKHFIKEPMGAGNQRFQFGISDVPAGMYILRMHNDGKGYAQRIGITH